MSRESSRRCDSSSADQEPPIDQYRFDRAPSAISSSSLQTNFNQQSGASASGSQRHSFIENTMTPILSIEDVPMESQDTLLGEQAKVSDRGVDNDSSGDSPWTMPDPIRIYDGDIKDDEAFREAKDARPRSYKRLNEKDYPEIVSECKKWASYLYDAILHIDNARDMKNSRAFKSIRDEYWNHDDIYRASWKFAIDCMDAHEANHCLGMREKRTEFGQNKTTREKYPSLEARFKAIHCSLWFWKIMCLNLLEAEYFNWEQRIVAAPKATCHEKRRDWVRDNSKPKRKRDSTSSSQNKSEENHNDRSSAKAVKSVANGHSQNNKAINGLLSNGTYLINNASWTPVLGPQTYRAQENFYQALPGFTCSKNFEHPNSVEIQDIQNEPQETQQEHLSTNPLAAAGVDNQNLLEEILKYIEPNASIHQEDSCQSCTDAPHQNQTAKGSQIVEARSATLTGTVEDDFSDWVFQDGDAFENAIYELGLQDDLDSFFINSDTQTPVLTPRSGSVIDEGNQSVKEKSVD